jgi:thiamine-phosphate pyrophosphorylase
VDAPAPILDYASPRKRVKLRLAANSILDCRYETDRVSVVETLKGRDGAIGAIIFACVVLLIMAAMLSSSDLSDRRHRDYVPTVLLSVFWLIEASLIFVVIHQTWRKTVLTVTEEAVELLFGSPFRRTLHEWPGVDVYEVLTPVTANEGLPNALAELRINLASGGEIHLFTDHPLNEIVRIAQGLRRILKLKQPTPPPITPRSVVGDGNGKTAIANQPRLSRYVSIPSRAPIMAAPVTNSTESFDGTLLRVLDANANRAREALRVIEDYARFVLNNDALCGDLKILRHDLSAATRGWLSDAIVFRDTPGDVGVDNKTAAEMQRADIGDVVIAAGKRLGEALRAIEEFSKTIGPADAAKVESIRYRFYSIEKSIALTLGKSNAFDCVRLYVLITESACKRPWLEVAEAAIAGGADCLQLREKNLESGELLRRAKTLVELCRKNRVLCIINDRPDIAMLSDADGVHVGQDDLPAVEVRKIVGRKMIVGVSTHRIEQAHQAVLDGADYIGIGPIFVSPTKPREILPGLDYARQIAEQIRIPAVAIAGITGENVDEVIQAGITRVAVTAAVSGFDDVKAAAERLKHLLIDAISRNNLAEPKTV